MRIGRVPNVLTLSIAALGFLLAATHWSGETPTGALAGFAVGLLLMLPGHVVGATGAGDVKLFAAIGTLLGPGHIAVAFLYTALAGGVIALLTALRRRTLGRTIERAATLVRTGGGNVTEIESAADDNRFAYAPAIVLGTLAVALGL